MKSKTGLCLTLLILALPTASAAQEFSAGARSLGIGGSFQALADDATAVFFNPAGGATLGKQFHGSIGTYSRFDDDGDRDNEPTPGPAFVGATYELSSQSAIIGGYYSPFVNERRYDLRLGIPANLSFRETRVEQFFNRLSLGYARSFSRVDIGADAERGALTTLALGATIDLSVTDVAGDLFDSDGQRDRLRARKVAPGFSLGILATLYDSEKFELRLGGAYHHAGDFDLDNQGFDALGESATASRLYDWPLIAGVGIAVRCLKTKSLVFVADYQFVGWRDANSNLSDSHNVSFGTEYAFFVSEASQIIVRAGLRRLDEPAHKDPFLRGVVDDHLVSGTLGLGLVYQPSSPAFYAADGAVEFGENFQYAVSLTLGF